MRQSSAGPQNNHPNANRPPSASQSTYSSSNVPIPIPPPTRPGGRPTTSGHSNSNNSNVSSYRGAAPSISVPVAGSQPIPSTISPSSAHTISRPSSGYSSTGPNSGKSISANQRQSSSSSLISTNVAATTNGRQMAPQTSSSVPSSPITPKTPPSPSSSIDGSSSSYSAYQRFSSNPTNNSRSSSSSSITGHRRSSSEEDDYSPKKKRQLATLTTVFMALIVIVSLCVSFIYIMQRLYYIPIHNATTATTNTHSDVTAYYKPLRPSVSLHHELVSIPADPPVFDLSIVLNHHNNLQKRLPFHPPVHNAAAKPPPPVDVPLNHPDYVPPPIALDQVIPNKFPRSSISYVTNITPKQYRKVATPGNIADFSLDAAGGGEGDDLSISDPSALNDGDDEVLGAGGLKIVAGVKLSKAELAEVGVSSEREWTEEERVANRALFKQRSLNKNLHEEIIWRPPIHTLTITKEFPPPITTADQYIFGDDYLFVMITEKKNHGLVRKIISTWGQYAKHWQIYSDFYDSKLNTTILKNPQPSYIPREYKYQSWRIAAMINHLAKHDELHYPFYMVFDQYSFPLLDQLHWRIEEWRKIWRNEYPAFIAGRPDKRSFKYSYWTEQQDMATKLFTEPLQVVPTYAYGFDHATLMTLSYYTPPDICPVLQEDNLALAGLVVCAGGVQQEYHFLPMTRSNHREKQLTATSGITQWRGLDIFFGERTVGMIEEAFLWYYGGVLINTKGKKRLGIDLDSMPAAGPAPGMLDGILPPARNKTLQTMLEKLLALQIQNNNNTLAPGGIATPRSNETTKTNSHTNTTTIPPSPTKPGGATPADSPEPETEPDAP